MFRHSARLRVGLTLVEVLVLLGIVVVVLALLFPAVMRIHQAAARLQSANHLKQMAMAIQCHHDARGVLPHGGTQPEGADSASSLDRTQWSWAYQILPYINEKAVYQADVSLVDTTPISIYYLPARRSAGLYNGTAKIDYAGNAGTGSDGVIVEGPHAYLRFKDIIDGTSNTVMLGEKQLNPLAFGQSADDNESYARAGWKGDFEVYRLGSERPAPDFPDAGSLAAHAAFGSPLSSGFNCGFADGVVRHIRYTVNPSVWLHVCTRNDKRRTCQDDL